MTGETPAETSKLNYHPHCYLMAFAYMFKKSNTDKNTNKTMIVPRTVFYGQYECTGAGANESKRVGWSHELTASQADALSSMSFIDGSSWVPAG